MCVFVYMRVSNHPHAHKGIFCDSVLFQGIDIEILFLGMHTDTIGGELGYRALCRHGGDGAGHFRAMESKCY